MVEDSPEVFESYHKRPKIVKHFKYCYYTLLVSRVRVSGVLLAISQRQLYSEQGRHSCHNDQQSILSWLSPPPQTN